VIVFDLMFFNGTCLIEHSLRQVCGRIHKHLVLIFENTRDDTYWNNISRVVTCHFPKLLFLPMPRRFVSYCIVECERYSSTCRLKNGSTKLYPTVVKVSCVRHWMAQIPCIILRKDRKVGRK